MPEHNGWGRDGGTPGGASERGWQDLPPDWQSWSRSAGAGGSSAPGPQSAPVPAWSADDVLVAGMATPGTRRRTGRLLGAVAMAAVLVAGGAGTSMALAAGGGGGASTPAGAVEDLLRAMGNSDVIGMMDDLAPGERNALAPGLEEIFGQLKRTGALSSGADLNDITGISVGFSGYQLSTRQVGPGIAAVTMTGGGVEGKLDASQLPLGTYFRALAIAATQDRARTGGGPVSGTTLFGTTEVSGKWYVSIGYSYALNILHSMGQPLAPPAERVLPVGAPSPQGAVRALFSSISDLDLQSLVSDLDPGELAALDTYAPLFLDRAQTALETIKSQVSIGFTMPTMTTAQIPGGTMVKFGGRFAMRVDVPRAGVSFDYAGGCYTITTAGQTRRHCQDKSATSQIEHVLVQSMPPAVQPIIQRLIVSPPDIGIVTSEVNGRWYVSPTRTYLQALNATLAELRPGDIQSLVANGGAIGKGFQRFARRQAQRALDSPGLAPLPLLPSYLPSAPFSGGAL